MKKLLILLSVLMLFTASLQSQIQILTFRITVTEPPYDFMGFYGGESSAVQREVPSWWVDSSICYKGELTFSGPSGVYEIWQYPSINEAPLRIDWRIAHTNGTQTVIFPLIPEPQMFYALKRLSDLPVVPFYMSVTTNIISTSTYVPIAVTTGGGCGPTYIYCDKCGTGGQSLATLAANGNWGERVTGINTSFPVGSSNYLTLIQVDTCGTVISTNIVVRVVAPNINGAGKEKPLKPIFFKK